MKFFIPYIENENEANAFFKILVGSVKQQMKWDIDENTRIRKIVYRSNGVICIAEVGLNEICNGEPIGETVIAILKSGVHIFSKLYFICTRSFGVIEGQPIMVGEIDKISIEYFDE